MQTPYDSQLVESRLEEASRVLYALRVGGVSPAQIRSSMPEVVRTFEEAYGWVETRQRSIPPPPAQITRMDEAFRWLLLIPHERRVLRHVVALRSLTKPGTGRHLLGWRAIGARLGASHEAARLWHAQGLEIITAALNKWAAPDRAGYCRAVGGPVGPNRAEVAAAIARARTVGRREEAQAAAARRIRSPRAAYAASRDGEDGDYGAGTK